MNEYDLNEDIVKVQSYLNESTSFETRLAFLRLLAVLKSWKQVKRKDS